MADVLTVILIFLGLALGTVVLRDVHTSRRRLDLIARQVESLTFETMRQRRAQERDEALAREFLDQQDARRRRNGGRGLRLAPAVLPLGFLGEAWPARVVLASAVTAGMLTLGPATPYLIPPPSPRADPPTATRPGNPPPSTPTPPVPSRPAPDGGVGAAPRTDQPSRSDRLPRIPALPPEASPVPEDSDWARCLRLRQAKVNVEDCLDRLAVG